MKGLFLILSVVFSAPVLAQVIIPSGTVLPAALNSFSGHT
jgi:hypothetical protein